MIRSSPVSRGVRRRAAHSAAVRAGLEVRAGGAEEEVSLDVAVKNVKQFIEQGADMITGGSSSGVAIAVSKLCQEKKNACDRSDQRLLDHRDPS